jgi:hypothetical protein
MKQFPVTGLLILASACTAASLQAQSREVRADVPFSFAVGSKQLPAGHYTFVTGPSDTILTRNTDNEVVFLTRTENAYHPVGYLNVLVFNKYGDDYFLREIRCPSIAMNVEIPQSKMEKQIRVHTARLGPDQTLLALK